MNWETAPDLLTVDETAALLNVSRKTVERHLRSGEWPGLKVGLQWRIEKDALRNALTGYKKREPAGDPMPRPGSFGELLEDEMRRVA